MPILGFIKTKGEKKWEDEYKIKQQLRDADKRIALLENTIKKHAVNARRALKEGIPDMVEFAKFAMRKAIQDKKMTLRWKINLEIYNDMKDSAEANKAFLKSIKLLAAQLKEATSIDAQKVFQQFKIESDKANQMIKGVQEQLTEQENVFKAEDLSEMNVSDKELETLIYGPQTSGSPLAEEQPITENVPQSAPTQGKTKPEQALPKDKEMDDIQKKLDDFKKKLDKR